MNDDEDDLLAMEMWIICNGDGGDDEHFRREWKFRFSKDGRDFWLGEAHKFKMALANHGLFVMRSRDA